MTTYQYFWNMFYLVQNILIRLILFFYFFQIGKAKLMYHELQGTTFHFEHCWLLLRFHPKWLAHKETTTKPKKKSVVKSRTNTQDSTNLEEDEASPEAFINLE
jgi:hypothetical protein